MASDFTTKTVLEVRLEKVARGIAIVVFAAVIAAYFGLVGVGQWQADEFADFARGNFTIPAFLHRLAWSPRPLSEALFAAYGWLTLHLRQPLIPLFLGALWLGFFASGLALCCPMLANGRASDNRRSAALAGLALMAAFLTANRLTEVFYWPAGAVAYLPTLSASLFVFLQVAQGGLESPKGRLRCGLALLCAALCSETGAFFAISYAAVAIAGWAVGRIRGDKGRGERLGSVRWVLWPGMCAGILLLIVRLNRFRATEIISPEQTATIGKPMASVGAALSTLATTILGPAQPKHGLPILNAEFLSIALLAIGVGLCLGIPRELTAPRRRDLLCLAVALSLGALLTLAASYVHLGIVGERHDLMVRCWVRLAACSVAIAVLSSAGWQRLRGSRMLGASAAVFLLGGVIATWHVAPLVHEYRAYGDIRSAIQENFRSGFAAGDTLEWTLPPNRGVITAATIEPGTYDRATATGYAAYILSYFNKQAIIVREAPK